MKSRGGIFGAIGRFAASMLLRSASTAAWAAGALGSMVGGGYQVLDPRRKILPGGIILRSQTANELSTMSLPQLRALCRKLERDNPTARAAVEGLVAQIVGTGIALEPDHGDDALNQSLRKEWIAYTRACDISGTRSLFDLQTQACRDTVVAGELLWRLPVLPERAGSGLVPLVVLPLECEWLASEPASLATPDGITAVAGIELDRWGRPVTYRLQNPENCGTGDIERVPSAEIVHQFERRRSLQNRGEPWLAPVIERIWQEGDLVDAELRSAINCAAMAIVITSDAHDETDTTEHGSATDPASRIAVGGVARVYPGEDVKAFSHNRPAQQIADFRRSLRGDIASACRVDQRWLDRDYGRANYSSMRASNIDSDRLLAPVREWFGHATAGALYVRVLPYLCVLAGVRMPKRIAYRLVPDGAQYVDPLKDAQAAAFAISAGLSTYETEIGKRGGDWRQVWTQAGFEQAEKAKKKLAFDLAGSKSPASDASATETEQQTDASGKPMKPVPKQGNDA